MPRTNAAVKTRKKAHLGKSEKSKRGSASLTKSFPLPFIKGKGDTEGQVSPVIEESVSQVPRCSLCREPLTQIAWNTSGDILICENSRCVRYRQPQGSIDVPYRSMDQVLGRAPKQGSRYNRSLL